MYLGKNSGEQRSDTLHAWISVPELTGKDIASLAASNSSLFALVRSDSLYRSTDSGKSWVRLPLAVNSAFANVHVHNNSVIVTYPNIQVSSDNGNLWSDVTNNLAGKVGKLSVNTATMANNILFAGMEEDGILSSTDFGGSWAPASSGLQSPIIYSMAEGGSFVYAGALSAVVGGVQKEGGLFVSTNNGVQWTPLGLAGDTASICTFAVHENFLIASLLKDSGVYRSSDNGISWSPVHTTQLRGCNSFTTIGTAIAAGCYGNGIYLSSDNGVSWSSFTSDLPNLEIYSIAACDSTIFVGTKQGVWKRKLTE